MMGRFGRSKGIRFDPQPKMMIVGDQETKKKMSWFVEFEGALAQVNEDTGKLEFVPRGAIHINVNQIGGFYDHTLLIFGNKIRVMETAAQIYMKIKEAEP